MKPGRKRIKHLREWYFNGPAISAMTFLMIIIVIALVGGSFIAWGWSWASLAFSLLTTQLALVYSALVFLSFQNRSHALRRQRESASSTEAALKTALAAPGPNQSESALALPDKVLEAIDRSESKLAQINDDAYRMHREVSYILSQLQTLAPGTITQPVDDATNRPE